MVANADSTSEISASPLPLSWVCFMKVSSRRVSAVRPAGWKVDAPSGGITRQAHHLNLKQLFSLNRPIPVDSVTRHPLFSFSTHVFSDSPIPTVWLAGKRIADWGIVVTPHAHLFRFSPLFFVQPSRLQCPIPSLTLRSTRTPPALPAFISRVPSTIASFSSRSQARPVSSIR